MINHTGAEQPQPPDRAAIDVLWTDGHPEGVISAHGAEIHFVDPGDADDFASAAVAMASLLHSAVDRNQGGA